MASFTKKELSNVQPILEKLVANRIGTVDRTVLAHIESNLCNGYDRSKLIAVLSSIMEEIKAVRIGDDIDYLLDNLKGHGNRFLSLEYDVGSAPEEAGRLTKKRPHDPERSHSEKKKRQPEEDDNILSVPCDFSCITKAITISGNSDRIMEGVLSSNHIKMMMENAQREIEERKRKLEKMKINKISILPPSAVAAAVALNAKISAAAQISANVVSSKKDMSTQPHNTDPVPAVFADIERSKKIALLQEQIRAKLSGSLANVLPQQNPPQDKPKPLILDAEGRTVDGSGRTIVVPQLTPTLKANIRAKKRESSKNQQVTERTQNEESSEFYFHDDRIALKPAQRSKRSLRFHEPGKFQQLAERMRMKAQLEKLQNEISQIARKTGISSATKLALIAPKGDTHAYDVPQMEWWDSVILTDDLNMLDTKGNISVRESSITNLIEHPTQMRPPNESSRIVYLPLFLTKKERRKLRRQNRREAWKEEQEKIRLGLEAPPEPKLRISNLMRVLGTEAVQDPTKIEAHVREQMVKRQKVHEEANAARKLTDDQRREKKNRKIKEDTTFGVHVAVYRIRELQEQQSKKFKVETNAKQLLLTGACVLFRDCCVVVVEGGPKQQKKYRRLMLHRIKWEEDLVKNADGKEIPNSCVLVWEGTNQRRNFGEFKYKSFPLEKSARDFFQKHHVEHYWDLAYSRAVLEASEDI